MGTSEINYFIFDFDFIMGNEMECNNIKTTKYRNKPAKKAGVKPKIIDKITERTEPRTDIAPLIPYIHGIYLSIFCCFNI